MNNTSIQCDYAIRFTDRLTGITQYRVVVPHGTRYPTSAPVHQLAVCATADGQLEFPIEIYERLEEGQRLNRDNSMIVFNADGSTRIEPVSARSAAEPPWRLVNVDAPVILRRTKSAKIGEQCFYVVFTVDADANLMAKVVDATMGSTVHESLRVASLHKE